MESLQVGDWVQTKEGHEGKILLISRMSGFVDIEGYDEMRTRPYLLSELTKIDPPTKSNKRFQPPVPT